MENRTFEKAEYLLTLKVMRLTKPAVACPVIVTNETKDLPEDILNTDLKNDITSVPGSDAISAGQLLVIPQSLGNTYLGESFRSCIFVHNDSLQIVRNVSVKADLQTASKRIELSGNNFGDLLPEHTINEIIHHEVREQGTHILICEVSYITPNGEKESFKKIFSFEVLEPLDLKTKYYSSESDEVFFEAHVQNLTTGPIHLEKVAFESSNLFKVSSLSLSEESKPGKGLLPPQASRQYLYCLTPISEVLQETGVGETDMGRLEIVWRSNFGEVGRIQTSQIQKKAPDCGLLKLSVHHLSNAVKIEEPFTVTCKISNLSNKTMNLVVNLEKMHLPESLIWVGSSGRCIGTLEPGISTFLDLTLMPLRAGLHKISGIRLKDTYMDKDYDYENIAQIFVT